MRVVLVLEPSGFVLLDEVITNGTTFNAAQRLLTPLIGDLNFVGLFVARRVCPPTE